MIIELDKSIDTIRATRKLFSELLDGLSVDLINKIPAGFNNNIIWNFGHVIVSQQIICYKMAGLSLKIDDAYVPKYTKGSKPGSFVEEQEVIFLQQQAAALIDQLVEDLEIHSFNNYQAYTTSFGVELNGIDDAIKYLTMHEGLHLGYAMALKRIVIA